MRFYTITFTAVLAGLMAFGAAQAESSLKAVVDARGKTVVTKDKECVRHKWDENKDECAPEPAPAPAPAPVVEAPPPPPAPPPAPVVALEQRTIHFDFDKDTLTSEAQGKLDALAEIVKGSKGITKASMVGYADIMGKSDYNVKLSERRVKNAQAYLASRVSIPVEALDVRGLGATNSKTDCAPKMKRAERIACLAQDRRVEVEFTYEK